MLQMDTKTLSSIQSLHLHQEIIEEILSRFPVKSLLRLRCVSKSWGSLIGSKRFIKTHLKNSTNNQNYSHWRVIFNFSKHGRLSQWSMRSFLDDENCINSPPIDDPPYDHRLVKTGLVMGCCNGLLCVVNVNECRFFMWNPAMRISIELPKIDHRDIYFTKLGFGWDEQSGAYKVLAVVIYEDDHKKLGKVYSSRTNSWKTVVEYGCLDLHCGCACGKYVCGRVHWLTVRGHIESFDLKSEMFGTMELPFKLPEEGEDGGRVFPWLWVIGGCLSVVCDDIGNGKRRVWVMKEYGVKESWVEMMMSQPGKKITHCWEAFFYPLSLVSPIPQENSH